MPAAVEFALPSGLDADGAVGLLERHLGARAAGTRTEERVLLDTFDGRLRAAGLAAERDGTALALLDGDLPARTATVAPVRRLLAQELPDGPVRERLAGVLAERALLEVASVRRRVRALAILDADDKTTVRLEVCDPQALVDGAAIPLGLRVRVRPVRGYDKAFERTVGLLTGPLAPATAPESVFDAAVRASGSEPAGVSSKVAVKLEAGTRADVAAGIVLARLAGIAEANVAGTLDDLDTEFLHDLRVSVRRARSVLRELPGVHPAAERSRLREELRWVQAMTGPVRDLDVQLLEWDDMVRTLPRERGADLGPLRDLLARRRATELRRLRGGLSSPRFAAALAGWRALAATPSAEPWDEERPRAALPIETVAADRILRVYRRMVRDGSAIGPETEAEALHELRKRGKELRYLLELFGGLFGATVVKPMVTSLKDLQDVLGRFQDRAVQVSLLRETGDELVDAEGGPGALMALGLVVAALDADQRAAREQFTERFAAFAAEDQRRLVRETFGGAS